MGDAIPLGARIIAVCDAYAEGVRAHRAPERARAELAAESGSRFDPAIVEAILVELHGRPAADAQHPPRDGSRRHHEQATGAVSATTLTPPAGPATTLAH
jgi:HD-GYP domain-containing protein (c-di-GMP phosphodiesterase class II)